MTASDRLFATRWVHVFEEDTAQGAVYRPDDGTIPLSRRPREHIAFNKDGSASVSEGGPDDRLVERPASWQPDGSQLVVRTADGHELRIVQQSADRLVVEDRRRSGRQR